MPALIGTVYENLDIVHLQIEGGNNEVKQYMLTTDTSRQTMFSLSENGELPIYKNKSKIKRAIASLKNINDLASLVVEGLLGEGLASDCLFAKLSMKHDKNLRKMTLQG